MSSYSIIERITEELRHQIYTTLAEAPDTDFSLSDVSGTISLTPPGEVQGAQVVVILYLYHVSQQQRPRNPMPLRSGPGEERHPPLPLQLRYLMMPVDSETNNQLMMGRILQHFHDHPVLESVAGEPLDSSFGTARDQIRISLEDIPQEQVSQLWNAFSQPMRLATVLKVDGVAIDSFRSPQQYGPVREAYTVLKQR